MEIKTADVAIKAAGEGKASVVIATLNTKDRDGDVLLPGAFGEQVVPVVGAHQWSTVPVGKARVFEVGNEAVAEIKFYLTTDAGKNWYAAIKEDFDNPPARQQYSWGFSTTPDHIKHGQHHGEHVRFLKATDDGEPLQIHEVSPVLVAAGMNTRSVSVKEQTEVVEPPTEPQIITTLPPARVISPHLKETSDRPWYAATMQHRVKASGVQAYYANLYAWCDPSANPRQKSSYRFLHHFVTDDGKAGEASIRACAAIVARLSDGGVAITEADRQQVYAHIAKHLQDAGRDVPELRDAENYQYPLDAQIELMLWDLDGVLQQVDQVRDYRARKGLTLTDGRLQQLDAMQQKFATLCSLVSMKALDRPDDLVLQELSEQTRMEMLDRRVEEMRTRAQTRIEEANAQAAQAAFARFQALQERIRSS